MSHHCPTDLWHFYELLWALSPPKVTILIIASQIVQPLVQPDCPTWQPFFVESQPCHCTQRWTVVCGLFCFLVLMGPEPRDLCTLWKCPTSEEHYIPSPIFTYYCKLLRLVLNLLYSSCRFELVILLSILSSTGLPCYVQLRARI